MDKSDPTTASTKYAGPIDMPEGETIFKAILVNAKGRTSGGDYPQLCIGTFTGRIEMIKREQPDCFALAKTGAAFYCLHFCTKIKKTENL